MVGFLGLTTPEAFASTVKGFRKGLGEAPADDGSALIFWLRTALRGRRCDVRKSGCHRACPRACATLPLETGHRAPAGRALEGLCPAHRQNRHKALSSVLAVPWRGLSGPAGPWGWRISPDREVGPLQPQPRRTRTFCLANGEPLRPIRRCERRSPPAVARLIGAGLCGSEPNRTVSVGHRSSSTVARLDHRRNGAQLDHPGCAAPLPFTFQPLSSSGTTLRRLGFMHPQLVGA